MPLTFTASRAVQRAAVLTALRAVTEGGTISYADLSAAAGEDVRAIRHVLTDAREIIRDQDGVLFETVIDHGLRRMGGGDVAMTIPGYRSRRARSQATKGVRELATVASPGDLPQAQRMAYQSGVAMLGAIAAVTSATATRRIQAECARVDQALTVAETLRLFETIA